MYFTADTHFGSKRHLELCKRPFTSVNQMNQTMIMNWNRIVNDDDMVFVLGDFGEYDYANKLNGKIVLICGNYEKNDMERLNLSFSQFRDLLIEKGFYDVHESYLDINVDVINKPLHLIHEPSKKIDNAFNLYGHVHKTHLLKRFGLNVGIDLHNYTPIEIDTILFYKTGIEKYYDDEVFID